MAFPTSPVDGDSYTDPTTNRKFIYNSANSIWKLKENWELSDYTSLSGSIAAPQDNDSLVAAASGTEYEPAPKVSNNFQARKPNSVGYFNWPGGIDFPSGALGINPSGNQLLIHPSAPTLKPGTEMIRTTYSSTSAGQTGSTFSFDSGEAFCFSFTIKEPATIGSIYNITFYNIAANTQLPNYLIVQCSLVKGREIDQDTISRALLSQVGGKVLSKGQATISTSSITSIPISNVDYSSQWSVGDTITVIISKSTLSTSTAPFKFDDWTGRTPTSNYGWEQVNTVISPGLVLPAGYTSLQDLSTTNILPFYIRVTTTLNQPVEGRKPPVTLYDYYERRKNHVPEDQNLEILAAPVTPTYSEFLADKYTIYNSTTSSLNYWDSATSSWIEI